MPTGTSMVTKLVRTIHDISCWRNFLHLKLHPSPKLYTTTISGATGSLITNRTIYINRLIRASTDCDDRRYYFFVARNTFRRMTSSTSEKEACSATSSSLTQVMKTEEELNGLENEFRNAVQITRENHGEEDTIPPISVDTPIDKGNKLVSAIVLSEDDVNNEIKASKSIRRIASLIQDAKNILILSGAGVSVAAGIPDFRTPGTGLYDNLQKYNLPYAEAVFDIQYYAINPKPFVQLASELWPDHHVPTITHSFIALLAEKQQLLRNYTQNIDGLESMAGVPEHLLVECHGHFRTASCIRCKKAAPIATVKESIVSSMKVPMCTFCSKSGTSNSTKKLPAYVKPDIVFFGENLPMRFHDILPNDVKNADLCIVMGTSLQVPPSAYIPDMVNCPRVLLNRELVGNLKISDSLNINDDSDDDVDNDVFECGNCDDSIMSIAQILQWEKELHTKHDEMINQRMEKLQTVKLI